MRYLGYYLLPIIYIISLLFCMARCDNLLAQNVISTGSNNLLNQENVVSTSDIETGQNITNPNNSNQNSDITTNETSTNDQKLSSTQQNENQTTINQNITDNQISSQINQPQPNIVQQSNSPQPKIADCKVIIPTVQTITSQIAYFAYDSPNWLNNDTKQLDTFINDHYNYFVTTKGNRVWSGALNIAWHQLRRTLLNNNDPVFNNIQLQLQQVIIQNLNDQTFNKQQLSQNSYYSTAGFGQQTINKINKQVRQKFPLKTFEELKIQLTDDSFISYAYIYKHLKYAVSFQQEPLFQFKSKPVQGFKIKNSKQKQQLYYKYYNDYNNFLMGIQTANKNDQILLLRNPSSDMNQAKFQKIIKLINLFQDSPKQQLDQFDDFMMPVLNFDFTRKLSQMRGLIFDNDQCRGGRIDNVIQRIKLKVNRQGVTLQNEAYSIIAMSMGLDGRRFYLNDDFWIILKQKGKSPYFVMLVRSAAQQWSNQ